MNGSHAFFSTFEDKYGSLIVLAGVIMIFVVVAMFLLFGGIVMGCSEDCANMLLGDNWTDGYVTSLAEQCNR